MQRSKINLKIIGFKQPDVGCCLVENWFECGCSELGVSERVEGREVRMGRVVVMYRK